MVLIKKDKNFCYIVVVIEKDKYDLLSLLHLRITNIYSYICQKKIFTYNFNLYQKNYIKYRL